MNNGFTIEGLGSFLPPEVLTNDDLSRDYMDTTDQWIRERTGIGQRHIGGTTSELSIEAGRLAMADAGVGPGDIDQLLLATTSPDFICPGSAPAVAYGLGLDCGALDIQAACSGWVYGLVLAKGLLLQGEQRILVIGAEALDRITDYTDRGTGILFGNGAGAAVVSGSDAGGAEMLAWDLGANGKYVDILYSEHDGKLQMDGKEVFRQAVTVMVRSTKATLARAGLTADDVDFVIPHQANIRIVETAWKKLGFTMEQTGMVLEETGNTSGASIPLALDRARSDGRIKPGDNVLLLGFGAGMTWASTLIRWPAP